MKSLFEKSAVDDLLERIEKLTPQTQHQWGKMTVDQMLAHCAAGLDMASGNIKPPRAFIGKLIGGFFKDFYTNDKPFSKNGPTDAALKINDARDYHKEKVRLQESILRFSQNGIAGVTSWPHPFFGKLTPEAWGIGMYKHMDHHFRQFGV
jgi:hypothetical protein